jgi:hypothetical protein
MCRVVPSSDTAIPTRNVVVIMMVMALAWLVVAVAASLLVGGGIRTADRHAPVTDHLAGLPADLTVDDVLARHAPRSTIH